ncbi:MAG: hypothetical protein ACUVUQ_11305 [Thermodesulfovibrionales bacterium]
MAMALGIVVRSALHRECHIYYLLSHRAKSTSGLQLPSELPWYKKYLVELIIAVVGGLLLKLFG